jgi:hypothetical protein
MSTLGSDDRIANAVPSNPDMARSILSRGPAYGPFVPVFILAVAVAGWFGFQSYEMWKERDALAAASVAQEKPLAEAQKLRDSLDTIAREVALLADKGNPNAKLVVDELRRRGITIDPNAPPTTPTPPMPTPATTPTPQSK